MARRRKNKNIENLRIEKYAAEGKSIGYEEGKVVFVRGAIPGDVVDVRLSKNRKDYAEGNIIKLVEPSSQRIPAKCTYFGQCGGCQWQMLDYLNQVKYKEQQVTDQMHQIVKAQTPTIHPILTSESKWHYRNKVEFSFSDNQYIPTDMLNDDSMEMNKPVLGFHARGFFDKVVEVKECHIQPLQGNKIREYLREVCEDLAMPYYNLRANDGFLRNVVIRETTLDETMVNVIMTSNYGEKRELLMQKLEEFEPSITSLYFTINDKLNDSIIDLEPTHYRGTKYIKERLGDFLFQIGPKSFFQTNSSQAEVLYHRAKEMLNLKGTEVLYDIYCGTGSIGIYLSDNVKKVYGVELVEEAIADAQKNAILNGVEDRCSFFVGDVSKVCNEEFFDEHDAPDVIILDPPRAGLTEKLIRQLIKLNTPTILYISCNPSTQARDLVMFMDTYEVAELQSVDLFPHTHHIENIALLKLKK